MRGRCSAVVLVLALGVISCSRDPEAAKRQFIADGDRAFAAKEYATAVVQYRKAVQQDPRFADARLKLADAYGATQNYKAAVGELVRAADLLPDRVDVQIRTGRALIVAGQYPEAKARAIAALAKEPRNPEALMLLGNSLSTLKDLDGAIEQVEQAIDENPQLTSRYANLGGLQLAKGDKEAAESSFRRAVEVAPKSVDAHLSLANFLWSIKDRSQAESELKIALQLDPAVPITNRALALLYVEQGKPKEAEPYFKAFSDLSKTVDSRLLLADFYAGIGKRPDAIQVLNEVARDKSGFVPATLRLAMVDFLSDRRPEAYRKLDSVLTQDPKNAVAREVKSRFLLIERKAKDSLTLTKALVADDDKSPTAHYLLGLAFEANRSLDEAVAAYQTVLKLAPGAVPAQMQLAKLYLRQGNPKGALELTQEAVKTAPTALDVHFVHAQALLKSGDVPAAERELLALAKVGPSSSEIQTWLGMLYETKRDLVRSRASYQEAFRLQPNSMAALAGVVGADLNDKKPAAALARIEARLKDSPDNPTLVAMIGMVHFVSRDWPKAEIAYRRVLELDPANAEAYNRLGAIYVVEKRLDDARKTFEALAASQPKPVAAETMLGLILAQQGDRAAARKHFERALELNPRAVVAANNLAWDYASSGDNLDLALQLAQTAKAESPDNADVNDTLGWIYYKKGLASPAVTALRDAARQSPTSASIHYHLGLAYLQGGNKSEAKTALLEVLKLNPQFPEAAEVRRVLASIES